jgi:hypothetical protein
MQMRQPLGQPLGDPEAVDGKAEDIGVTIHHQAAEAVAVGMDHAPSVGDLGQAEEIGADTDGGVEEAEEVGFTERLGAMVKDPEGDPGAGMIESGAEGVTELVIDGDQAAGAGIGRGAADHGRVERGMSAKGLEMDPRCAPGGGVGWDRGWEGGIVGGAGTDHEMGANRDGVRTGEGRNRLGVSMHEGHGKASDPFPEYGVRRVGPRGQQGIWQRRADTRAACPYQRRLEVGSDVPRNLLTLVLGGP